MTTNEVGAANYRRVCADLFGSPDTAENAQTVAELRELADGYKAAAAQWRANYEMASRTARMWRQAYEHLDTSLRACDR